MSDRLSVIRRDETTEALIEARDAIHRLCLERGSTDGYGAVFEKVSAALATYRGAVDALTFIRDHEPTNDEGAAAFERFAHDAKERAAQTLATLGGQ